MNKRIFELDILRGIALILMIIFHVIVDLSDLYGVNIDYTEGVAGFIGHLSAYTFIAVSGISSTLSRNNLKRGFIVLGCGLIVTVVTYIFMPESFVVFGILQFLGCAMIICHLCRSLRPMYFPVFAILSLVISFFIKGIFSSNYLLLPFGIMPHNFLSMDYYPLFPYLSLFFAGVFIGKTIYKQKTTLFKSVVYKFPFLSFLSRHSLILYLIHQPICLLALRLIFFFVS